MTMTETKCIRCQGVRWLCEQHPDRPFGHDRCTSAGDPCPTCNAPPVPTEKGDVK